jgi:hypothetical protein
VRGLANVLEDLGLAPVAKCVGFDIGEGEGEGIH